MISELTSVPSGFNTIAIVTNTRVRYKCIQENQNAYINRNAYMDVNYFVNDEVPIPLQGDYFVSIQRQTVEMETPSGETKANL